jgi:hypothetical protein
VVPADVCGRRDEAGRGKWVDSTLERSRVCCHPQLKTDGCGHAGSEADVNGTVIYKRIDKADEYIAVDMRSGEMATFHATEEEIEEYWRRVDEHVRGAA